MPTKLAGTPAIFEPTLLATGYTAGQSLFTPEQLSVTTQQATLVQLGIFWDIASAPEMTIYFFNSKPVGFGDAGDTVSLTFDERASLIGVWNIDSTVGQGYSTLLGDNSDENSYDILTGDLAHFDNEDNTLYMAVIIKSTTTVDLSDKLRFTMLVRR